MVMRNAGFFVNWREKFGENNGAPLNPFISSVIIGGAVLTGGSGTIRGTPDA